MPLLGAHMSVAGGLHRAFDHIMQVRGRALQIFTKNQRQWLAPPITAEDVDLFQNARSRWGDSPIAAHDTYLINLASPKQEMAEKSVAAFADELDRAALLTIPHLIMHPGSHLGAGVEAGLTTLVRNLDRAIETAAAPGVMVLLETTAGQGTNLGSRFEEIAFIISESRYGDRLGVCLDTCHIFAAGYDIRTPEDYQRTISQFDRTIGLERLKFFHLNDSKKELGGRVDRHEHIGRGAIGLEGFRLLLNDPRFANHPMTLETPKGKDLLEDVENLAVLRKLLKQPASPPPPGAG